MKGFASRFGRPSSSLEMKGLLEQTRKGLWLALVAAVAMHLSLTQIRGLQAEQKAAKPLTTQFVKRPPRLTKPLELKKRPQPKRRQLRRRMVAVRAQSHGGEGTGGVSDDIDQYRFLYPNNQEKAPWANLGAPLFFLPSLYKATANELYLNAAMRLFELVDQNKEYGSYAFINSSKVLWGFPLLYNLAGDERVFEACVALADYFCEKQEEIGGWTTGMGYDSFEAQPDWIKLCQAGDILLSLVSAVEHL